MNNNNSTYKRLGDYIEQRREKNKGYDVPIRGVSREGFIPPKQQDADVSLYNVFYKNDFVFNPARMELNSIALNEELEQGICSSLYEIFYIKDTNILDPLYLNLLIKTDHFTRFCEFVGWGSVREYCRFADISEYYIEVPPIEEQHKIVSHFNAIRTRIANNKQTIAKLEEAAQALYRKMFVDDVDVENLPDGWRMGCLGEVCEILDYKRKPLSSEERAVKKGIYPYYGAMSIVDYIDSYIFDGVYLLFSEDGANIVDENGFPALQYVYGKFWLNNHAHILQGKENLSTEYLFLALKRKNVADLVTGAAQPKINQENMCSIEILKPDNETLNKFNKKILPIFSIIKNKEQENKILTKMLSLMA